LEVLLEGLTVGVAEEDLELIQLHLIACWLEPGNVIFDILLKLLERLTGIYFNLELQLLLINFNPHSKTQASVVGTIEL